MAETLVFDADDTLWENNIYFEQAFERFVEFLNHSTLSAQQIRAVLDEIEIVNNSIYGYGSINFARNLSECYQRLAERKIEAPDLKYVMEFGRQLLHHPMEVIDGVPETLQYLSQRHHLLLFTKGNPEEQKLKLDRSGLAHYFAQAVIVKEKDALAYRKLVRENKLDPVRTWMIGNSPKSDVNPALEVGLNAVFIPHAHTWTLERQEILHGDGRLLVLENFRQIKYYF
jgi:putative hydrolase of the HAD superfamily